MIHPRHTSKYLNLLESCSIEIYLIFQSSSPPNTTILLLCALNLRHLFLHFKKKKSPTITIRASSDSLQNQVICSHLHARNHVINLHTLPSFRNLTPIIPIQISSFVHIHIDGPRGYDTTLSPTTPILNHSLSSPFTLTQCRLLTYVLLMALNITTQIIHSQHRP